jgi:hypothetical protein
MFSLQSVYLSQLTDIKWLASRLWPIRNSKPQPFNLYQQLRSVAIRKFVSHNSHFRFIAVSLSKLLTDIKWLSLWLWPIGNSKSQLFNLYQQLRSLTAVLTIDRTKVISCNFICINQVLRCLTDLEFNLPLSL